MRTLLVFSAALAALTAGAGAQVPAPPAATPSPPSTPHVATAQPTSSIATPPPTAWLLSREAGWGVADHGLRLAIDMSSSFGLGSEMPFTIFVGNFSSETLRYDNCVSANAAARSFSLYDRKGRAVAKNTGIAYPIGCVGPREVRAGGIDTIVSGSIGNDWVLVAGTYTLKVSTSIGLQGEAPMARLSASRTFTIAAAP